VNWCRNNNGHSHILSHYTWKYRMSVSLTLSIISLPPFFLSIQTLHSLHSSCLSLSSFSLSLTPSLYYFSHSLSLLFVFSPFKLSILHTISVSLFLASLSLFSLSLHLSHSVIFSLSLSYPLYSF